MNAIVEGVEVGDEPVPCSARPLDVVCLWSDVRIVEHGTPTVGDTWVRK